MVSKEVEKILPLVQKPGRYIGGELNSVIKDKEKVALRYAFCFPDSYEIGMSHLGMKILYSIANEREDVWCERVFAPWHDMEAQMRKHGIPLCALESGDAIKDFDLIAFTLMYELSYSNVLNMLDLAGLPVRAADRHSLTPIVIGGGPCACNPEPMAEFFDIFSLGEGEEVYDELFDLLEECKKSGSSKEEFLRRAAKIDGMYVPSLYDVEYNEDKTIKAVVPKNGAPEKIRKRIVAELDSVKYPDKFVVPYIEVVHDRVVHEILRGCIRGCRFCQAGFLYRPIREKSPETINSQCRSLCDVTGYDEISLSSLSTSDYTQLEPLLDKLLEWTIPEKINIALPSLRVDNFSDELMEKLNKVRRSGLTFAPEAGTQRLRDAINKNVTEDEVLRTSRKAFEGGWTAVKLYFMLGLPTETFDDVAGIAELAQKVVDEFYKNPNKPKGKGVQVSISVASFVPKPFTPFQWEPQDTREMLLEKQAHLLSCVKTRKVNVSYHKVDISFLEGVFARGDRRLSKVIYYAWQHGCKFDGWDDSFLFDTWLEAFEQCGVDPLFYTSRKREFEEILPWDHLDYGIRKEFLISENKKAHESVTTPHCRIKCAGCGANRLNGGKCDAMRKNLV
ncbi:MAG: TIGR03960 family B12-binding radical SAM protein [Oscillospiraceae bacterium]|nr:TIGR03960 family B12-binding radical SAM protein [Oscillospiraceae bacterium]MDD7293382.1 TIGR03960 family B12-binding radical SAM protein [Clostridiaceae bacterium]MDY5990821.1 TIGR03960 family B12-binding radical SAM protein [Oscillospiraceae bacterium]